MDFEVPNSIAVHLTKFFVDTYAVCMKSFHQKDKKHFFYQKDKKHMLGVSENGF